VHRPMSAIQDARGHMEASFGLDEDTGGLHTFQPSPRWPKINIGEAGHDTVSAYKGYDMLEADGFAHFQGQAQLVCVMAWEGASGLHILCLLSESYHTTNIRPTASTCNCV
jgi:hypothetical protein